VDIIRLALLVGGGYLVYQYLYKPKPPDTICQAGYHFDPVQGKCILDSEGPVPIITRCPVIPGHRFIAQNPDGTFYIMWNDRKIGGYSSEAFAKLNYDEICTRIGPEGPYH